MNSFSGKFDKSHVLFLLAVLCLGAVVFKVTELPSSPNVRALIIPQKGRIQTLDQKRVPKLERTQYYSTLDFPSNKFLKHKNGEIVGFNSNFFIDFSAQALVKVAGSYQISVATDDGFRLKIDDRNIGQFLGDRPSTEQVFDVVLSEGVHNFEMQYFQGSGNAAAVVRYKAPGQESFLPLGSNSSSVYFTPFH
jgi:hypothetical protein